MIKKLKDNKGETLVELMAAILIASLSVALLFSCVMVATNINQKAKIRDKDFKTIVEILEVKPDLNTIKTDNRYKNYKDNVEIQNNEKVTIKYGTKEIQVPVLLYIERNSNRYAYEYKK